MTIAKGGAARGEVAWEYRFCLCYINRTTPQRALNAQANAHGRTKSPHVGQGICGAVVAGYENGARRKLSAMLNPGSKFVRVNDVIVSLEKLELLPEDLGTNEAAIEKMVASRVAEGGPRHDK